MRSFLFVLFITALTAIWGCKNTTHKSEQSQIDCPQKAFFKKFKQFEGQKFYGKQVFIAEGMNSWANEELEMYIRESLDTIIYIPFRVGVNTSRTWMFILENGEKLRFRHDHRHADGTPENLNLYGGYATNNGTAFQQVFPADEYTCQMLQRICDNEWTAEFSGNLSLFSYSLYKKGELVFKAEFDLTVPH